MLLHLTQLLIEVDCSYVMHKVNEAYCVPQRSAQSPTAEQGDSGTARSLTFIHSAFKSTLLHWPHYNQNNNNAFGELKL